MAEPRPRVFETPVAESSSEFAVGGRFKARFSEASLFYVARECVATMKELAPKLSEVDRFCDKNSFRILVFGGKNKSCEEVREVKQIEAGDFQILNELSPLTNGRVCCEAVCLKGEEFVFSGTESNGRLVDSLATDSRMTVSESAPALCLGFSACAFADEVFAMGGLCERNQVFTNRCWQFYAAGAWEKMVLLGDARKWSASAAYRGMVVTCDGYAKEVQDVRKTAESYDGISNRWTRIPCMVRGNAATVWLPSTASCLQLAGPEKCLTASSFLFSKTLTRFAATRPCRLKAK